jgi:hypothetical protein
MRMLSILWKLYLFFLVPEGMPSAHLSLVTCHFFYNRRTAEQLLYNFNINANTPNKISTSPERSFS